MAVYSLRSAFFGQNDVTRTEFFNVSRELLRSHVGVQVLEWVLTVNRDERNAVEEKVSNSSVTRSTFSSRPDNARLSGEELLLQLQQMKVTQKIVVMSGYGEEETMKRCAELGVVGFIGKPFELHAVIAKLHSLLA